jgi:hypothetical protein
MLIILGLAILSSIGGVVAVILLAGGGVSQIEATPIEDAQGRAAVRFSNRGTRRGYLCGWVSLRCPGSEKRSVHLCAKDLEAGAQSTVTSDLRTAGRTGCEVSFLRNDEVDP